jgi:3-oxoadipate enol-lactonase
VPNVTTALLDTGETDLPPVVCLHSLFLDPSSFDGLVAAGKGRFRFVRPTFPGQGTRTDEAVGTVTMDDCAADVISSLDELGITRYALIGQSMGGDVAVRMAAFRPAAVNALVFVGSSVRAEPDEQRKAFTGVVNHMESNGFDELIQQTVMQIMLGATTRQNPEKHALVEEFCRRFAALPANLAHATRGVVDRADATDLLGTVTAPTLVINGTDDIARPPAWTAELLSHLRGAKHVELEGVGHSPTQEAPETVLPLILDFLDEHSRSR